MQTEKEKQFEIECARLVGQKLVDVYYEYDVDGYLNTRKLNEVRFEYIPLSRLVFEMQSGLYYTFFDSGRFLEEYGYYTLDLKSGKSLAEVGVEAKQSTNKSWSNYLGQEIVDTAIIWDSLYQDHLSGDPDDLYPRGIEVSFSGEDVNLVLVASEFELVNGQYNFMCPDEALIVCYSRQIYDMLFGK